MASLPACGSAPLPLTTAVVGCGVATTVESTPGAVVSGVVVSVTITVVSAPTPPPPAADGGDGGGGATAPGWIAALALAVAALFGARGVGRRAR